jgi:hypothetical protein
MLDMSRRKKAEHCFGKFVQARQQPQVMLTPISGYGALILLLYILRHIWRAARRIISASRCETDSPLFIAPSPFLPTFRLAGQTWHIHKQSSYGL